jgi:hypothetical protein
MLDIPYKLCVAYAFINASRDVQSYSQMQHYVRALPGRDCSRSDANSDLTRGQARVVIGV